MLGSLKAQPNTRFREHGYWVSVIEQALHHYGRSLSQSTLIQSLAGNNSPLNLIEQPTCSLIWSEAVRLADDELFGLRLNRLFSPTIFNSISLTVSLCPTFGAALEQLVRFFPVLSMQMRLELVIVDDEAQLNIHAVGQPHQQQSEALLGYLSRLLARLDHDNEGILKRGSLPRPLADLSICQRLLGCEEISSANSYAITIPRRMLDKPLATADTYLLPRLTETLSELIASLPCDDLVEQIKRRVQLLLGSGDISVERIVSPMNISPRHLRRKLSQEGTSYEQLVDEVRRENAMRMIGEGQLSLTSIAYELGFLDPSSFTRAFRRWTDMSPTAFRRQVSELSPQAE